MFEGVKCRLVALVWLLALPVRGELAVEHVVAAQLPGTKRVEVAFDISAREGAEVSVALVASNGNEAVSLMQLSGDVGDGVKVGSGKRIVWDAGADCNGVVFSNLVFCVTVDDTVSLLPLVEEMGFVAGGVNSGVDPDFGAYSLKVDSFCMGRHEVTKALWDEVAGWASANGYDLSPGDGSGKGADHPVQEVTWYECVKWCNARSEMEGRAPCYLAGGGVYRFGISQMLSCRFSSNGYRLPTGEEWEYAARAGLEGRRFPWGNTVSNRLANYKSNASFGYDEGPVRGYYSGFADAEPPYTSPVGSFPADAFGRYDMAGNVWEWCWDVDETGRSVRGGCWFYGADFIRCGFYGREQPTGSFGDIGFRVVYRDDEGKQ